ncbi:hypothetical protein L3081_12405 [Colwellia sp. MSW7]|uniref:Uncharacterized protein n=1 Tax=Colwellia maritima TaxID=2912588 RepID=A0ABS9X1J3_9GAMM|nr:hypothetical protein [Colwellia maritima]MCI2284049.1 hypothetical protein [Colwellia maritima]
MKNITIYLYKLVILATSLVMVYFATGIATIAQATELLKADPIEHETFISQAQDNLALTFSTISVSTSTTQNNAKNMIAMKQVSTNKDNVISLNQTLLSE